MRKMPKVTVKALEWLDAKRSSRAQSLAGEYLIDAYATRWTMFTPDTIGDDEDEREPTSFHETLEAAKAAAQADYETRILSALISSPGKDGGQEVEAVKTVWQVADAIDPERSPDGGWRDQLLNEIHADLENRGRRDKDFAVTVHHRNIVISAVSKALRGLSSSSEEQQP